MLKRSLSSEQVARQVAYNQAVIYDTKFNFLKSHCGIRPSGLHGMIGTMGSGKSTLMKRIGSEIALTAPVHWHLSEETVSEYQPDFMLADPCGVAAENITWSEEGEIAKDIRTDQKLFHEWYLDTLNDSNAKFAIIDNITSSTFFNERVGTYGQMETTELFMYITKKMGIGLFYLAHTGTHIKNNHYDIVTPEDIRGLRQLPLRTEYFYTFQKYTAHPDSYRILTVHKHRHHKDSGGYYMLNFSNGVYNGDNPIPFETVKSIFKRRDKL